MKIFIIFLILAILTFFVVFSFCACVVAHDADQHLEMIKNADNNIFNIEKENRDGTKN